MTNQRAGNLLAIILLAGCGLAACTTQEAKGGTGGSGTTGAGGGAATGSGGTDGGYAVNDGVLCPLPMQALITSFTYAVGVDGATTATDSVHFGDDSTTFSGSEYIYPTTGTWPLVADVTGSSWHISGTVGDYSGFGLSFDSCTRVDASKYTGISFSIGGTVAQGGIVTLGMGTLNDTITAAWLNGHGTTGAVNAGACNPPASATNQYTQSTCADPTKVITVPATSTVQTVKWADFTGGKPETGVTPSDILTIYWFFPPPAGAGTTTPTTYAADITIDDLTFTTN